MAPQSGQVQVIPLQVMPQKFSSMQSQQIINPHGQFQQKGSSRLQVLQIYDDLERRHLVLRLGVSCSCVFTA